VKKVEDMIQMESRNGFLQTYPPPSFSLKSIEMGFSEDEDDAKR
jgi:hypothetical protein